MSGFQLNFRFFAVILLGLETLVGVFLYRDWREKDEQYLRQQTLGLETAYRSSVQMFALATDLLFQEIMQRPEVVDTLKQGFSTQDEEEQAANRGKLYRLLYPTYAQLKKNSLRQFHFHQANGASFLRFHEPARFGDALFDIRPSVRIANVEKRPVSGFETGRVLSGFRYVYPILIDGEHLGSMEASVSFRAIRDAMATLEHSHEYAFILSRGAVEGRLAPEQISLYASSGLHDDYLVEDPRLQLPDSPPPPSARVQALNALLKKMPEVAEGMHAGKPLTVKVNLRGETMAAAFLPVKDVEGRQVAYVVSYSAVPLANLFLRDFVVSFLASALLLMAVGVLFWHVLRSRAALEAEKQSLKVVTDTVADGLYAMDKQGLVTLLNPSAEKLLGFKESDVLGKVGHDLFHSHAVNEHLPKHLCPIYRQVSRGEIFNGEEVFSRQDGSHLPVEISSQPMLDHGKVSGSVTVFRDITERKKMESALTEAKAAAENANRMKSEFLANMSHEIRTPMNGIIGLTRLVLDSDLEAEQREHLEMVRTSADTLMTIINDILDFSKIEAGRLTLERTAFRVRSTLEAALQPLFVQARQKGLEMTLDVGRDVPEVIVGDPVRLSQVLINLVGNAVKFTQQGCISVEVSQVGTRDHMARLGFGVTDTGTGIPANKQESIFESFSQADASITRKYGGTGLGLAIVRQLVRMMGGEVRVDSRPGQGSRFHFDLDFKVDGRSLQTEGQADSVGYATAMHILLVEDNAVNRKLATVLLAKAGHRVSVAEDGGEALALLTQPHDYDAVLLDVQMPVMDGLQVARALRQHEALHGGHLPVIALTANAMVGDRERFMDAGMDDYVSKPINVGELLEALERVQAS
ncbi:MAG: response regulator [Thiobacillus sp.]|nr:response regulator [Thiobacillus sp.]